MSFATFSSLSFALDGDNWDAELDLWNGSSASNTLRLLSVRRRIGEERLNPLNPIFSTSIRARIWDKNKTIHAKLLNNDKADFRLTLKKNSNIWFQGLLGKISGGFQVRYDNPALKMVFHDGLPFLKTQDWSNTGRLELLETLWHILSENTRTDQGTRVSIAWEDAQADTSNGRSRALQHDLEWQQESGSYWDVLTQILRYYNLQIVQLDGKWRILHRSYRLASNLNYEQKDNSGTITTGTISPGTTISDSDWVETPDELVRQPQTNRQGWQMSHQYISHNWISDFNTDRTEPVSGTDMPKGWFLTSKTASGITFDKGSNEIEIIGASGVSQSYEYAEQLYDEILVNEAGGGTDTIEFDLGGEIDIDDTSETSDITPAVGELTAIDPESGDEYYWSTSANAWVANGQSWIRATVAQSNSGVVTRTFSVNRTLDAPSTGSSTDDFWILRLRLVAEEDPDNDSKQEVDVVRHQSADLGPLTRNVSGKMPVPGGIEYSTRRLSPEDSESSHIGCAREVIAASMGIPSGTDPTTPSTGIRFLDSRDGNWHLLHFNSTANHVSESYTLNSPTLSGKRMADRLAQTRKDLFYATGHQKKSLLSFTDTVTWDGRTWIPYFFDEVLDSAYRRVGLVELRTDSTSDYNLKTILL